MNVDIPELILVLNAASTLFMVGLIWFVQIVHYPLMAKVGHGEILKYELSHTRLTTWVVAAPMLTELITTLSLLWIRPATLTLEMSVVAAVLLSAVLLSTQLLQIPCHRRLSLQFETAIHRRLVITNWIRTVGWSLRGVLVTWAIWKSMQHA